MPATTFEDALSSRLDEMVSACTRCGACFTACPITDAAGLADADPKAVVSGVLDLVKLGEGPAEAERWATSCVLSGECIKACDYGVNPRFLLAMARLARARKTREPAVRRKQGVDYIRKVGTEVSVLAQLQVSEEVLIRLGQRPAKTPPRTELPDVVFYTGCNVLKTPHIALLCLDMMDALGVDYQVMGGPTHCCGVGQLRAGDAETSSRFAANTISKLSQSKSGEVLAWCPSCFVHFSENMLPTFERLTGETPFDMTPFMRFLHRNLDALRPMLAQRVEIKVALHRHPGVAGVAEAAEELLRAVPGIEIVKLDVPAVGLQSATVGGLPLLKKELQRRELERAEAAGVDALVAVYHSDHRELCAHERDWPFKILNVLEVVGASMGLHHEDHYKRLKLKQDVDAVIADASDLMKQHGVNLDTARAVIVDAMLGDQPLPLRGNDRAATAD
jgi:heterodisulfide reductase subunit D